MSIATEDILQYDHPRFKDFVAKEVEASHGKVRTGFRDLTEDRQFAERAWRVLFEIKYERDLAKERTDYVMAMITRLATRDLLVKLNDRDFQTIVDDEVRRPSDSRVRFLFTDVKLIERWRLSLIYMKKNVESQMGARADDVKVLLIHIHSPEPNREEQAAGIVSKRALRAHRVEKHREAQASLVVWRAGAKRFKLSVEERLLDIQRIQLTRRQENLDSGPARMLMKAIERHHARVLSEFDDEVSDADSELWATLQGLKSA